MPGEIEFGERLLQESEKLMRYAKMMRDQREDYQALIAEIEKYNSLDSSQLTLFLNQLQDQENPWFASYSDTQSPVTIKKQQLDEFLFILRDTGQTEQKDNQLDLLTIKIVDHLLKLQSIIDQPLDLVVKVKQAFLNKFSPESKNDKTPNPSTGRVRAPFTFALICTRDELASNHPTGKYLDELYARPDFKKWISQFTHRNEAKKLAALEKEIVMSIADNLIESCKRELSYIFEKIAAAQSPKEQEQLQKEPGAQAEKVFRHVQNCILDSNSIEAAARMKKRWIQVADECQKRGDFHTFHAIFGALNSLEITRLKKVDALLDSDTKNRMVALADVFKNISTEVIQRIRETEEKTEKADVVPYYGAIAKLQTYINELEKFEKQDKEKPVDPGTAQQREQEKQQLKAKADIARKNLPYFLQANQIIRDNTVHIETMIPEGLQQAISELSLMGQVERDREVLAKSRAIEPSPNQSSRQFMHSSATSSATSAASLHATVHKASNASDASVSGQPITTTVMHTRRRSSGNSSR